jgi:PAS domain S-box-containing protein
MDITHPDDFGSHNTCPHLLNTENRAVQVEKRYRHKNGSWVWTQVTLSVVRDGAGIATSDLAIVVDIRDRKAAEQALARETQRLEYILQGTNAGTWEWNIQTGETVFNERWANIIGYTLDEISPVSIETWMQFAHPDDLAASRDQLQRHFRHELDYYEVECRMKHKDGHWVWVLDRGKVFCWDAAGQPLLMSGTHQDITQRKQAEQELIKLKNNLQLTNELANVGFWEVDLVTHRIYWSDVTKRIHGVPADFQPDLDTGINFYKAGDHRDQIAQAVQQAIATGEGFDLKLIIVTAQHTETWVRSVGYTEMVQGNCVKLYGIFQDISQEKAYEDQILASQQAAIAANTAKSEFLANMSHELRTPLNAILGFTQILTADPSLLPQQRDYVHIMHRSGDHLLSLINSILDLSKIEANRITLDPVTIDFNEFIADLRAMFRERSEHQGLWFSLDVDSTIPRYIETDPNKLRQVLINLLSNAIKFTQTGGITLRVSVFPCVDACCPTSPASNSADYRTQQHIRFEVEDTGVGIAPEELSGIFDAFTQAKAGKASLEGTGLGLAISRRIVELMGGELLVESVVGQGSRFWFSIPLCLGHPEQMMLSDQPARVVGLAAAQADYRILIVDDQADNRHVVTTTLEHLGFPIRTASNGEEAIACWQEWHPHLIWMDMRMPVMDGCEATRRIRSLEQEQTQSSHHTYILALSAQVSNVEQRMAFDAGCDDFVRKPVDINLMLSKMADYLDLQYEYAELSTGLPPQAIASLQPDDLQVMSKAWIAKLHQAALCCYDRDVSNLIKAIPVEHQTLVQGLTHLLNTYAFESIIDLTQPHVVS